MKMARKKATKDEVVTVANNEDKETKVPVESKGSTEYEVADNYKSYNSLIVGGILIPIIDGKVTVGSKTKESLKEKGFLK